MKRFYKKHKKKIKLIFLLIISLIAGLHLLIEPENVKHFIIRGVGLVWLIESYLCYLKLRYSILKEKTSIMSGIDELS